MSDDIITRFTLGGKTETETEGGSSVEVSTGDDKAAELEIYVSVDKDTRDCALLTDFPGQLIAALELQPANLPDLQLFLQVPLASLKTLLIKQGISGGDVADAHARTSVVVIDDSYHRNFDDPPITSVARVRSHLEGLPVGEPTYASSESRDESTSPRPDMDHPPRTRPIMPEPRSQSYQRAISIESPHERPVTPDPTAAGLYSAGNRDQNREQLQGFARNADIAWSSGLERSSEQGTWREIREPAAYDPMPMPAQTMPNTRRNTRR